MQCEEFEDRINAVLDERGRPECDAELRLHCETCPECRQLAAAYGSALDGFYTLCASKPLAGSDPLADLADRVLADLRPQRSTARRVSLAVAALATAAGLLIAFTQPLRSPEVAQESTEKPLVKSPLHAAAPLRATETAQAKPAATTPPALAAEKKTGGGHTEAGKTEAGKTEAGRTDAGNTEAGNTIAATQKTRPAARLVLPKWLTLKRTAESDPYADLAKETGRGLATLVLYVPGFGGRRGIIDLPVNAADTEPTWAVQMSEGLKPVTESVTETFNILLRTLPMTDLVGRS